MSETWDSAGYIASSRYRLTVCEYLANNGSGLPSRIAVETELAQPHVSRALSELREQDIVELLVPESQQKGRLYGLTDLGQLAYERVALDQRTELAVVDSDEFPASELLTELEETHADVLQAVVFYQSDEAWVHFFAPSLEDNYDEETLKTIVTTLVNQEPVADSFGTISPDGPEYIVFGLEKSLVVRIPMGNGANILISVDKSFDSKLESLAQACLQATRSPVLDADD